NRVLYRFVCIGDDASVRLVPAPQLAAEAGERDRAGDVGETQSKGEVGFERVRHGVRCRAARVSIVQRKSARSPAAAARGGSRRRAHKGAGRRGGPYLPAASRGML